MNTETKIDLYNDAQERLVSSLIYNSEYVIRVLEMTTPEAVVEPKLNIIFTHIANLARREEAISPITIAASLEEAGELEKIGGINTLFDLKTKGQRYSYDAPVDKYAEVVKEYHAKHRITSLLQGINSQLKTDSGFSATSIINDLQSGLNETLLALSDDSTSVDFIKSLENLDSLLEERRLVAEENANGLMGIPTLLPTINKYTSGFKPGQMITVGARTGIGKTVFAVNCATAALKAGKSVQFFTLEMSAESVTDRLLSSMTNIPYKKLEEGNLTDEERSEIAKMREESKDLKLLIEEDANVTIDQIVSRAIKRAQSPEGLDMLIVDYLGLIKTNRSGNSSRQENIAELSRNFKLLAKSLKIPVVILVQLNREGKDDDPDRFPTLADIRESAAIAMDSDIVFLIHRAPIVEKGIIPDTYVAIAKQRSGATGIRVRCTSNLKCSLLIEKTSSDSIDEISDNDISELDDDLENDFDLDDIDDLDFGEDD